MKLAFGTVCLLGLLGAACKSESGIGKEVPSAQVSPTVSKVEMLWSGSRRFEITIRSLTDAGVGPIPLFVNLRGKLDVQFDKRGETLVVFARLIDPALSDQANRPLERIEGLLAELRLPFAFEIEKGRLSAYYDPPLGTRQSSGYRAQIASLFQFEPHAGGGNWISTEWDATGSSTVEYSLVEPGKLSFKRLEYTDLVLTSRNNDASVDISRMKPTVRASAGSSRFDSRGTVELTRHEEFEVPLQKGQNLRTDVETNLKRLEEAALGFVAPELSDPARRRSVSTPPRAESKQSEFDAYLAEGKNFADVEKSLSGASLASIKGSAEERAPLFRALVAILRTQPSALPDAIRVARSNDENASVVSNALAVASTKETLTALGGIIFDRGLDSKRKHRAASALLRAPHPSKTGYELVVRLRGVPELRRHGILGLGTFVRHLREDGELELATSGATVLREDLERATTNKLRVDALLGIANSGASELYESVAPFLKSDDRELRDSAIQALRLMNRPEVEAFLSAILSEKDEASVRSALHALARRTTVGAKTVSTVISIARDHTNRDIRKEAVLALGEWAALHPEIPPVLESVAEKDQDRDVRGAAKSGLPSAR